MTSARIDAVVRWTVVLGLLLASAAHVPVIPEHLHEAPYMGAAFIAFTTGAAALAIVIAARPSATAFRLAGLLCAAAVVAYVLTRLIAFPQLADDVGNWTETLGLISITTESLVVALCALAGSRAAHCCSRRSRRASSPFRVVGRLLRTYAEPKRPCAANFLGGRPKRSTAGGGVDEPVALTTTARSIRPEGLRSRCAPNRSRLDTERGPKKASDLRFYVGSGGRI